jgi:murein DD-endopeptidase MepM/ murein hydrolase activator NlpD
MHVMLRWLTRLVVLLLMAFGVAYVLAGRAAPPVLQIDKPDRVVGQSGTLEVTAEAPGGRFTALTIVLEQNGKSVPLFSLDDAQPSATMRQIDANRIGIARPIGKKALPDLQSGAARIVVNATRPSFLGLRTVSSSTTKDFQVRLEPPRIAVLSTHHYVNHGGSEMVVYRATPPEVTSGVRVGDVEYPGFPAAGTVAGAVGQDPAVKVAFFALLYDQDLNTPIVAFARDEGGNEAKARFVDNVFEKPFRRSRIELDDRFLNRVVPEILEHSPELQLTAPPEGGDMLPAFLRINGELRKINADQIAAFAAKTSAKRLWTGPFTQLGNSQVEAAFADQRTYFYGGKEVDRQVHLGFDLAVTAHIPVAAANDGTVLHAGWLGIYGNCIILDHGTGVQSLYAHLMSFDVNVGDDVRRGQTIGRSDSTGLAGGDHLHFTMLVNGRMVTPVEWWDAHWVQDRVDRKLADAGGPGQPEVSAGKSSAAGSTMRSRPENTSRRRRR